MRIFNQVPVENLDYSINWQGWLGSDTISSIVWTVATGLTKTAQSNTTTKTTIWLTGGVVGSTYTITAVITTAAGRIKEAKFGISVQDIQ